MASGSDVLSKCCESAVDVLSQHFDVLCNKIAQHFGCAVTAVCFSKVLCANPLMGKGFGVSHSTTALLSSKRFREGKQV